MDELCQAGIQKTSFGVNDPHNVFLRTSRRVVVFLPRTGLTAESLCHVLTRAGLDVEYRVYAGHDFQHTPADLIIVLTDGQSIPMSLVCFHIERAIPLLVVVDKMDRKLIHELMAKGVSGVLTTNESIKVVLAAIQLASVGGTFAPREIMKALYRGDVVDEQCGQINSINIDSIHPLETFTGRERDVLARLRQGLQNKIIAHDLGISENTVKVHLHNIMKKLSARNRTQVIFKLIGGT